MLFKSSKYEVVKVLKKTKAYGFWKVKEGDILRFEILLKRLGRGSHQSLYAPEVKIIHQDTNIWKNTYNQLVNNLKIFELEEIEEE